VTGKSIYVLTVPPGGGGSNVEVMERASPGSSLSHSAAKIGIVRGSTTGSVGGTFEQPCAHCGATFAARRRGRPARYCSDACRRAADVARSLARAIAGRAGARCDECGATYTAAKVGQRFCSPRCRRRWHERHGGGSNVRSVCTPHPGVKTLLSPESPEVDDRHPPEVRA